MEFKERFEQSWDAEEALRAPTQRLRAVLAAERSPESRKRELMAEFDRWHARPRSQGWFSWRLVAASLALLALAVVQIWRAAPGSAPRQESARAFEQLEAEEGFAPLPYAMPLADGERLWVERTELDGAALARLGLDVPLADGTDVEADVLLGDDGLPRAVRVVGYVEL